MPIRITAYIVLKIVELVGIIRSVAIMELLDSFVTGFTTLGRLGEE